MVLSKTKIEDRGISILKDLISKHHLLREELKSNDKTEAVDGVIKLYKDNPDKKENLLDDNIKVQIKTSTKVPKKDKSKISINLADIRAFQQIDGVIYFKIYIYEDDSFEIYYRKLLPVNLIPIITKMANSKTISMKFSKLRDTNHLHEIVFDFYRDRNRQRPFNKLELANIFLDENIVPNPFTIHGIFDRNIPLISNIVGKEYTAYEKGTIEPYGIPMEIPRYEMTIAAIQEEQTVVNGKVFNVKKTFLENNIMMLGKSFKFDIKKQKIDINISGTLNNRIEEIKCFLEISPKALNKAQEETYNILNQQLILYQNIKQILEYFKVTKDLDYDNLNDKDITNLNHLLNVFVNKRTIPFKMEYNATYTNMKIGNINLCIFIKKDTERDGYIIENYNSAELYNYKLEYTDGSSLHFTNKYLVLNSESFQADNFIKEYVVDSIDIKNRYDERELELINTMILNIVKAYDVTGNEKLLTCAKECSDKLLKLGNIMIYKINNWQILHRLKKLTKKQIDQICNIIDANNENFSNLFALNTLIGDKKKADKCKKQISKDEFDHISQYPIITLYNKL